MAKDRSWDEFYRVVQGRDFLFVENEYKFRVIPEGLWKHLQRRAAKLLKDQPHAATYQQQHWQSIVDGTPPYGFVIESKNKKGKVK